MKKPITIEDLNDHYFEDILKSLQNITSEIQDDFDQKISLKELLKLITWSINSLDNDSLMDMADSNLTELKAKITKTKRQKLIEGDIFQIPRSNNKCLLVIYLHKNRFGHSFGFFLGEHSSIPNHSYSAIKTYPFPKYLLKDPAINGEWPKVGNSQTILEKFQKSFEYYHLKKDHKDNESIGEFGSAENENGDLRALSYEEFKAMSLDHPNYSNGMLPVCIDKFYNDFLTNN